MATVALVVHNERSSAAALARDVTAWVTAEGHQVRIPTSDATYAGLDQYAVPADELGHGADVAVSLGGDGTMLRTIQLVAADGVPVIGVNMGQLGYLTEVEPPGLHDALDRFFRGDHAIEERMLLAVHVDSSGPLGVTDAVALNEAVLEKTLSGHTVRLDVDINGSYFTPYATDGLIVATPTGSTAYAFSARGPIIAPTHRALLLTPVSPHMLFDRSLVLDPETHLCITVDGHRPAALTVDGRFLGELQRGDRIECSASAAVAHLVIFAPRDFHRILKKKFGLSDR